MPYSSSHVTLTFLASSTICVEYTLEEVKQISLLHDFIDVIMVIWNSW